MADPSETTQIGSAPARDERAADSGEVLEAIRELSGRVGSLQSEVRTLRAQTRPLPGGGETSGWDDPRGGADPMSSVRALDAPTSRTPSVPRLLLEIVFLVSVAIAVAIAELDTVAIVGVMAGAWALVALAEYVAARAARRRAAAVYAPLPGLASGYPTDPAWFAPPVERAVLETTGVEDDTQGLSPGESQARLPPPSTD